MRVFARLLNYRSVAWLIVALTIILGVSSVFLASRVVQDDDLLAFLPEGNEDIKAFQNINERFGGMDVALVGLQTQNPFDDAFLGRLKQLTEDLNAHEHVDYALSLTNVDDYAPDPDGGIRQGALIQDIPDSAEAQAALRSRVMSKDHLIGNVISADGRGVMIYAFATYGTDARALARMIRDAVTTTFPPDDTSVTVFWGGAPFISSYIYDACQRDLFWLSPLSVIVIIGIILLSFRDWIGSALALVSTLIGVFSSQAAMVLLGVSYNIVLSGMPVILFAVGSAYSIHMLSRYYANARERAPEEALERTLVETGPIVIAAGLTTVAGLGSFVVMDIAPMRTFGLFTAFGIFVTLAMSITFVPAVIRLVGLKGRHTEGETLYRWLLRGSEFAQNRRNTGVMALVILAVLGGMLVGRVDSRVDQSAFFSEGSEPDNAQTFLDSRFGGSQFLQIHFKGDVANADVVREIRRIADQLLILPDVSDVIHIGEIISLTNDAMHGNIRIPDNSDQTNLLLRFLTGNRSVGQVITEDRTEALLHVKIGSNGIDALERVLNAAEVLLEAQSGPSYTLTPITQHLDDPGRAQLHALVADRIRALIFEYGATTNDLPAETLIEKIANRPTAIPAQSVGAKLAAWLNSGECWVELTETQAQLASEAWAALGPEATETAVYQTLLTVLAETVPEEELEPLVQDLAIAAEAEVATFWRGVRAQVHGDTLLTSLKVLPPEGPKGDRFKTAVASALLDLDNPHILIPNADVQADAMTLDVNITGLPQLYRGLSRSISGNQVKSLALALGLVFLIMTLMFRSVTAGLVATSPTFFTLLVVYGAMGLMEVHLDIGTSMLASLIIGAGVDYSVHLMAAWRGESTLEALRHSVKETAPAIWTNALMVAAGFFVLSLGEARPLQNVGLLTAAAMLAAAVGTFLVIPVFARRKQYLRSML